MQYELDVLLGRGGVVAELAGSVGRARNGQSLPRQEENHATVARRRVQQPHGVGTKMFVNIYTHL